MLRILVWLILSVGLLACEKSRTTAETEVNLSECSNVWIKGDNTKLCYDSLVQDSRCPAGVVCSWEGMANVKLSLQVDNAQYLLQLSTVDNRPYFKIIDTAGYRIELLDVHPYPGFTTRSSYTPIIKVRVTAR